MTAQRLGLAFLLTCPLGSQQVLALRLVGVDGGDGHVVGRVGLQVLQEVVGLVVVQDRLEEGDK